MLEYFFVISIAFDICDVHCTHADQVISFQNIFGLVHHYLHCLFVRFNTRKQLFHITVKSIVGLPEGVNPDLRQLL